LAVAHPLPVLLLLLLLLLGSRLHLTLPNKHQHPKIEKVTVTHDGKAVTLDVPDGRTILEVALDQGIDLPHDCKLGVCMTCPAKLKAGKLEQPGSMLSEDVEAAGFALLCVAQPHSDCELVTCSEEELLDVQLCA
jgi:ferredoxin